MNTSVVRSEKGENHRFSCTEVEGCDRSLPSEMADNERRVNASPTSKTLCRLSEVIIFLLNQRLVLHHATNQRTL